MSTVETTKVLDKIRQRGNWSVVIRPTTFNHSRIPYDDLFSIIARTSVRYKVFGYPDVSHGATENGSDWVGLVYEGNRSIETWRFHTSGLFIHYFAVHGEWENESKSPRDLQLNENGAPAKDIDYMKTLFRFVEIFEFASRLALSPAGDSRMRVQLAINKIQDRKLVIRDDEDFFTQDYKNHDPDWKFERDFSQTDLITLPRELAATATRDFFVRFGLDLSVNAIRNLQEGI